MMIDAHIASFLTGFFLDPDAVSERRQLVKLIVLFLIHDILNSDNPSFSMKNYVAVLICRVRYIKNLKGYILIKRHVNVDLPCVMDTCNLLF